MGMGWIFPLVILTVTDLGSASSISENVDLIELNHFHDCLGRHVYDQVIFYEWSNESGRYHVRAWCLVEDRELISRRPSRTYTDGRYHVRWQDRDQNLLRKISSQHFRETWTQTDPERSNKKLLDERLRTSLVKRKLERPSSSEEWIDRTSDVAMDTPIDDPSTGAAVAPPLQAELVQR